MVLVISELFLNYSQKTESHLEQRNRTDNYHLLNGGFVGGASVVFV